MRPAGRTYPRVKVPTGEGVADGLAVIIPKERLDIIKRGVRTHFD